MQADERNPHPYNPEEDEENHHLTLHIAAESVQPNAHFTNRSDLVRDNFTLLLQQNTLYVLVIDPGATENTLLAFFKLTRTRSTNRMRVDLVKRYRYVLPSQTSHYAQVNRSIWAFADKFTSLFQRTHVVLIERQTHSPCNELSHTWWNVAYSNFCYPMFVEANAVKRYFGVAAINENKDLSRMQKKKLTVLRVLRLQETYEDTNYTIGTQVTEYCTPAESYHHYADTVLMLLYWTHNYVLNAQFVTEELRGRTFKPLFPPVRITNKYPSKRSAVADTTHVEDSLLLNFQHPKRVKSNNNSAVLPQLATAPVPPQAPALSNDDSVFIDLTLDFDEFLQTL
jgi:hypothetical protein